MRSKRETQTHSRHSQWRLGVTLMRLITVQRFVCAVSVYQARTTRNPIKHSKNPLLSLSLSLSYTPPKLQGYNTLQSYVGQLLPASLALVCLSAVDSQAGRFPSLLHNTVCASGIQTQVVTSRSPRCFALAAAPIISGTLHTERGRERERERKREGGGKRARGGNVLFNSFCASMSSAYLVAVLI